MTTTFTAPLAPFHLAFPVRDLTEARQFYGELLGCSEGRSSPEWIDFNFYGHQIVAHLAPSECGGSASNAVDGHGVPVRHFGVVLSMDEWNVAADKLRAAGTKFVIEPYLRFKGEVGEQATMFFTDPSGNAVEMKAFANIDMLFAK
jgi:extradiol dioxygenase family protein